MANVHAPVQVYKPCAGLQARHKQLLDAESCVTRPQLLYCSIVSNQASANSYLFVMSAGGSGSRSCSVGLCNIKPHSPPLD